MNPKKRTLSEKEWQRVLAHVKAMSPEELVRRLSWRPANVEETWLLKPLAATTVSEDPPRRARSSKKRRLIHKRTIGRAHPTR